MSAFEAKADIALAAELCQLCGTSAPSQNDRDWREADIAAARPFLAGSGPSAYGTHAGKADVRYDAHERPLTTHCRRSPVV